MTRTELPWTIFHRGIRPVALGLSLATFVVLSSWVFHIKVVDIAFDTNIVGVVIGSIAGLSTLFAWFGWWLRNETFMRVQLITAAGVFTGIWAANISELLALCLAIIAGGSYLLEATARDVHG